MYVPPWTILAGLGALQRDELCDYLASFEATKFVSLSLDRITDMMTRIQTGGTNQEALAFVRRLEQTKTELVGSSFSDKALRIRLFLRIAEALGIDLAIPLSTRRANTFGAALGLKAAAVVSQSFEETDGGETSKSILDKVLRGAASVYGRKTMDFEALVTNEAQRLTGALKTAVQSGSLSQADREKLLKLIREHLEKLPNDSRKEAMLSAVQNGDFASIALLASGTTALATGIGVNLAGFSAYILAAQTAAYIPFLSGPAAVSILALLANPLFTVPAVLGAGYALNRKINNSQAAKLASALSIQLALRGLSSGKDKLADILNEFRTIEVSDVSSLPATFQSETLARVSSITSRVGGQMPKTPGTYGNLRETEDSFARWLGSKVLKNRGDAGEMAAVASITTGEMLYNVASIDPLALAAADFSRSENISDIFSFGTFADKIASMGATSATGASNNLRGYISEQLVAAKLVESGHVVSFPNTSNNPGFDLIVDGIPFQVKCLADVGGLREHFSKYPDMPVYVNTELAEHIINSNAAWAGKVFFVDGFERALTDRIMETSLNAGEALGDLNVPYFAMAISAARNLHQAWLGRIPLSDVPFTVAIDAGIKGTLAAVGGLSGKLVGLIAFGPAGALVFGGLGGAAALAGSGWTKEQSARLLTPEWLVELDTVSEGFRKDLLVAITSKLELINAKRRQLPNHPAKRWIEQRFFDEIVTLCEVAQDLKTSVRTMTQPAKAKACLVAMNSAKVHPLIVQTSLAQILTTLNAKPTLSKVATKNGNKVWGAFKSKLNAKRDEKK